MTNQKDEHPISWQLRDMKDWERFKFLSTEWAHAYVNLFTETYREIGLPTPQGLGKISALAVPLALFAAIGMGLCV